MLYCIQARNYDDYEDGGILFHKVFEREPTRDEVLKLIQKHFPGEYDDETGMMFYFKVEPVE